MNNDRIITLENISDYIVGLKDTQGRVYTLQKKGKQRISAVSLQDILDYPASKSIFLSGDVIVSNISASDLYKMGLSDKEIKIIAPEAELDEEETVEEIPVIEDKEEEKIEEIEEEKEVVKPVVTKKPAAKKTTAKKTIKK